MSLKKILLLFLFETGAIWSKQSNCLKNETCLDHFKTKFDCIPVNDWNLVKIAETFIQNICISSSYDISKPPVPPTQVACFFADAKLLDVNERKQEITMMVWMFTFWEDPRIKVQLTNQISKINLPPITATKPIIWHPFAFLNIQDMKEVTHLFDPLIVMNLMVVSGRRVNFVTSLKERKLFHLNATVLTGSLRMKIKLSCEFDFTYYPFDYQICAFRIITNGINGTLYERPKHNISFAPKKQLKFNGFDLDRITINDSPELHPLTQERTIKFGFDLQMKRETATYFYQYFIPVITIVIISFFSFIVPLTALPGRVAILVTQFLTLTNIFIHEMVSIYMSGAPNL